jgi:DNA replicative helicase MCM subunit Mcm2 (Cdc46/Mcm family)
VENLFSPDVPILLIGAPGVGKTARVQAHFDHAEVVLTSTLVEEDIAGLPYREGDYDYRTVPAIFRRLHEAHDAGKSTVLFLDELDKARRAVADTLLTLVASRRVGNASLPANTCIVAAANPPEFGGGDGISDAMMSRFSAIDYTPDVREWSEWAESQFTDEGARRVIASIRNGELAIFDMVGDGQSRRITSPRTLAMALRAFERNGLEDNRFDTVIRGLLTPASASQILHIVTQTPNAVMSRSVSNARSAVAQGKTRHVLRL